MVKQMTKTVIEKALRCYTDRDVYYLKLYFAELDSKTLDVLKNCSLARNKLLDSLSEQG